MRAGTRIGDWFLWLDVDTADLNGQPVTIVTARKAVTGGEVLVREFATHDMAKSLRLVADRIDEALSREPRS